VDVNLDPEGALYDSKVWLSLRSKRRQHRRVEGLSYHRSWAISNLLTSRNIASYVEYVQELHLTRMGA